MIMGVLYEYPIVILISGYINPKVMTDIFKVDLQLSICLLFYLHL